MAEVYRAYHPGLDRYVAIKVLHSFLAGDEDFLTRFQREAKIVATFRHPNIVQVYDFDFDAETNAYYMVMEFVDGPNLKTRLQEMTEEDQVLPLEETVRIIVAVASALDYAHQHGMVHRDVKPANIIFTQDGQIILSDFGIARMVNTDTLTASGAMVGTPAYMAPEQGMGQAGDERADIYSLGVVLYQLATGSLPFDADTPLGIVLKHINTPLTPPTTFSPALPQSVEAVIMRALAKGPNNRYQTVKEFATDLEKAMAGETIEPISPELAMTSEVTLETAGATTIPHTRGQVGEQKWLAWLRASAKPAIQAGTAARSRRGWVAVWVTVLILILLGSIALVAMETPGGLLASLFSQTVTPTPSVTDTPTSTPTPDLTATYDAEAAQFVAWMATYEATTGVTPTPSPTLSPTPTSTPTPDLTATAIAACVFDMKVVNDPAVRPSVLTPGQRFVKRWTIENTGTCAWPADARLVFVFGDELDVVTKPGINPLSPGETIEIQVTLRAPASYDSYTSAWQLQYGDGNWIGEELEVTCRVGPTPTPRPTATPTATPTPEVTPTPAEPLWMSVPGLAWCDPSKVRGRIEWGRGGGPSEEYRYFRTWVSLDNELLGPFNEFEGFPHVATYFTTSGDLVFPVPSNCCPGDYGQYASPEGYEIAWYKVWHPAGNCPE